MLTTSATTDRYDDVWRAAAPYMTARKNYIHVPLSFAFAERLLESFPEADTDVVLLGILLHDIGWQVVDSDDIKKCFESKFQSVAQVVEQHEKEGARLARNILEKTGWAESVIIAVSDIIDGHDTRMQPQSLNDRLVRDADKLWRFSVTGLALVSDWFKMTPHQYIEWCDRLLLKMESEAGRVLAAAELEKTRAVLKLKLI
jgi:hypothetical protein